MKLLFIHLLLFFSYFAQAQQIVILAPGQEQLIPIDLKQKVHISNSKILKINDLGKSLKIQAKKIGQAKIRTNERDISIYVVPVQLASPCQKLNLFTEHFLGLQVMPQGEKCLLQGKLLRFYDWLQIADYSRQQQISYVFQAYIDREQQDHFLNYCKNLFVLKNLPLPEFSFTPRLKIQIGKDYSDLLHNYQNLLSSMGVAIETSPSIVALKPLIRVKVFIVELNKNIHRKLGLEWSSNYMAQLLPSFSNKGGLFASLHALENSGDARVLASPNLLSRSGAKASFFAGGELPISSKGYYSSNIIWKKYGVDLDIQPTADFHGNMSIKIRSQISSLDESTMINDVPGVKVHSIESHFDIKGNKTIALSGLIKSSSGQTKNSLPYLTQIPILGKLFRSENFLNQQSELVVFVQPRLLNANNIDEPIIIPQLKDPHELFKTQ